MTKEICENCKGTGMTHDKQPYFDFNWCTACNGTGKNPLYEKPKGAANTRRDK